MITSIAIMIITTTTSTTTTTAKTRAATTTTKIRSQILNKTIMILMKKQFTSKSYKHNCRKFERKNIQIF